MATLPSFQLLRPKSLHEALAQRADLGASGRLIAGGTDLVVNLRQRLETPRALISLARLTELRGVSVLRDGTVRIGALTTIAQLAADEFVRRELAVLAQAAQTISAPTLRRMGTIGGNVCLETRCHWYNQPYGWRQACGFCLKKDGDRCHVAPASDLCWAVASGDLAPALLTLDASVQLRRRDEARVVPLDAFFVDDGIAKFDLGADEILTDLLIPPRRRSLSGRYEKLRRRGAIDFPLAGVAIAARLERGVTMRDVRVALTAVAPRPFLVRAAAAELENARLDDEERLAAAAELVRSHTTPLNTGGPLSPAHRRLRVGLMARDGLRSLGTTP